jgi:TM2 domain-containing membrane protein YozV
MSYYYANGDQHRGPFTKEQLAAQALRRDTMVWKEGMPQWQRADSMPELADLFAPPPPINPGPYQYGSGYASAAGTYDLSGVFGTKLATGICAILVGWLGVHKFIIGANKAGIIMLVLSCTGIGFPIMHVIAIIEGIIYLTRSDAEFYQTYLTEKKAWF